MLPGRASRWVVGNGRTLLWELLLLGAMIGWSGVAASQGQDGLVHSGNQSAHDVGTTCIWVVHRSWFATCCTGVSVVHITTVGVAVVPILPMPVGSGRTECLLLTATRTAESHCWLLQKTLAAALTATVAFVAIIEHALLLSRGVDATWGLLADGHVGLLNVRKLALCNQAVGLALHCFLRGGIQGAKVCKQVTVGHKQHIVVHSGHTVSILQGRDSHLVDKCNRVSPIFIEGVNRLDNWRHIFV